MKLQDLVPKRIVEDELYASDPQVILHQMLNQMARQIDIDEMIINDLLRQAEEFKKIFRAFRATLEHSTYSNKDYIDISAVYEDDEWFQDLCELMGLEKEEEEVKENDSV